MWAEGWWVARHMWDMLQLWAGSSPVTEPKPRASSSSGRWDLGVLGDRERQGGRRGSALQAFMRLGTSARLLYSLPDAKKQEREVPHSSEGKSKVVVDSMKSVSLSFYPTSTPQSSPIAWTAGDSPALGQSPVFYY